MAFGITHKFNGGTKEQYDASVAVVHKIAEVTCEKKIGEPL